MRDFFSSPAPSRRQATVHLPDIDPLDFFLHLEGDVWISDVIDRGEIFDGHILKIMRALIGAGDTFIDVGANIGWFSVIGSRLVGKHGQVLSFEPSPKNIALMKRNLLHNKCSNVILFDCALGAGKRQARLYLSEDNQGDHRLAGSSLGRDFIEVEVTSLDDVLEKLPSQDMGSVVFVKIDTQGSETAVLSGMRGLRASGKIVRIVLEFWPQGLESCDSSALELLDELGREHWKIWQIHPGGEVELVSLDRLRELARTDYEPMTGIFTDLLLLPEGDTAGLELVESLS
jgi:FkbM family methyltransferase